MSSPSSMSFLDFQIPSVKIVPDEPQSSPQFFSGKMVLQKTEEDVANFVLTLIEESPISYSCGAGKCESIQNLDDRVEIAIDKEFLNLINRINELASSSVLGTNSFHEVCYSSLLPQELDREDSFEILDAEDSRLGSSSPPLSNTGLHPDLPKS